MRKDLHPWDDVDYMCQEKKEKEDMPTLKSTLIHRYNDSKKSAEEDQKLYWQHEG